MSVVSKGEFMKSLISLMECKAELVRVMYTRDISLGGVYAVAYNALLLLAKYKGFPHEKGKVKIQEVLSHLENHSEIKFTPTIKKALALLTEKNIEELSLGEYAYNPDIAAMRRVVTFVKNVGIKWGIYSKSELTSYIILMANENIDSVKNLVVEKGLATWADIHEIKQRTESQRVNHQPSTF